MLWKWEKSSLILTFNLQFFFRTLKYFILLHITMQLMYKKRWFLAKLFILRLFKDFKCIYFYSNCLCLFLFFLRLRGHIFDENNFFFVVLQFQIHQTYYLLICQILKEKEEEKISEFFFFFLNLKDVWIYTSHSSLSDVYCSSISRIFLRSQLPLIIQFDTRAINYD